MQAVSGIAYLLPVLSFLLSCVTLNVFSHPLLDYIVISTKDLFSRLKKIKSAGWDHVCAGRRGKSFRTAKLDLPRRWQLGGCGQLARSGD
ncbi:MAG: hypothetical protein LUQ38_10535 [Methanotrichaceae archaeon]|nr:hypothetical protein [Methanotrichaceae archaeon]MDD1757413.1 hypothetical protein [Methanotrichaceae archaeon]